MSAPDTHLPFSGPGAARKARTGTAGTGRKAATIQPAHDRDSTARMSWESARVRVRRHEGLPHVHAVFVNGPTKRESLTYELIIRCPEAPHWARCRLTDAFSAVPCEETTLVTAPVTLQTGAEIDLLLTIRTGDTSLARHHVRESIPP